MGIQIKYAGLCLLGEKNAKETHHLVEAGLPAQVGLDVAEAARCQQTNREQGVTRRRVRSGLGPRVHQHHSSKADPRC